MDGYRDGKLSENQIQLFCQQIAVICYSDYFKQLHKEMSKRYKKNGIENARLVAFQDSLFTIYMEQDDVARRTSVEPF